MLPSLVCWPELKFLEGICLIPYARCLNIPVFKALGFGALLVECEDGLTKEIKATHPRNLRNLP